jgi:hypothetical protein
VEEQDARLFPRHVLVNRDDLDVRAAQRLEHRLQLRLEHREIAIHDGLVVASCEGGPGVDAHRVAHCLAMHLRLASDRNLVDAALEIAGRSEHCVDLLGIERALGGIDLCVRDLPLPPLVSVIFAKTLPTAVASTASSPVPPMCMNITFGLSQKKWL